VVSCDLGYMKPHPRIFEHVFTAMGIDARETAMVGDSLKADVQGAQALGMTGVWRRVRRRDRRHEPEEVGEGQSASRRPASRADTGRALGEFGGGEDVTPDYTIWELSELRELPIFAGA
ncbi:MAG: HAD family hydrolase, partial [Dehalococcoidia bacterium]